MQHDCQDLIRLFDGCFEARFNTVLRGGAEEPLYRPAGDHDPRHCVVFTRDYFASALHEVAHWCIAGARRRQLEDYGYWYCPDGRDADQQRAFERVEARPQAIEWAFHIAAGSRFRASADNLSGDPADLEAFRRRIFERLCSYRREGFPPRAQVFIDALCSFYDRRWQLPDAA